MYSKLFEVFFCILALRINFCKGSGGCFYTSKETYLTAGNPIDYMTPAVSAIECAVICNIDARCATFSYDEKSKTCHLSEGLAAPSGPMFGPFIAPGICPLDLGYKIYIRQKHVLCLNMLSIVVGKDAAKARCDNDGAHLVLVEQESEFEFVCDIANANNWGETWIDADAPDNQKEYRTFKGDPLTFVPPGSILTDPNELCLRLVPPSCEFVDYGCNGPMEVVCQIDV